jgi:hypothetical protein
MSGVLHPAGTLSPSSLKTRPCRALCPACVPARPRPCRPPAPLRAAVASSGSGRLHAKPSSPPAFPTPTLTHQPPLDPCIEPPTTGTAVAAATTAGHRHPTSPALPLPNRAQESTPRTRGSIPARTRPVPAAGSPEFAGPPLASARDDIARFVIFQGSFVQSKCMVANLQKLPGASAQSCNFNSVADLQKLVKFVAIRRKF